MNNDFIRMKLFLMIFKVFGLAPWTIERKFLGKNVSNRDVPQPVRKSQFTHSKLDCVYPIFLVIFNFVMWIVVFSHSIDSDYPGKSQITVMIDVVVSISGNVIAAVLRLTLCVKQKMAVNLLNRLTNIDGTIVSLSNGRYFKSNELFFIFIFSTSALFIALHIPLVQLFYGGLFQWSFIHILPTITIIWFVMQYIVIVKLLNDRFQAMNRALLHYSNYSNVPPISSAITRDISILRYRRPKIVTFRQIHTELYEITREISEFYSLPILPSIAHLCFGMIYSAHYFVNPTILRGELYFPPIGITCLTGLLAEALPIVILAATINKTNFEIKRTTYAVHELLGRAGFSRENDTELRQFSMELLHRNVEFTAYGLFSVDCTLLLKIFNTVVRYLMIVAQFQSAGKKRSP